MYPITDEMHIYRIIYTILAVFTLQAAHAQGVLRATVLDKDTREPIIGATIHDAVKGKPIAVTDAEGCFTIPNNDDTKQIRITYIGYKILTTAPVRNGRYLLEAEISRLGEVVVTAQESRGLTSASTIGKHAMEHLQPSSFADLLELLPGGRAETPSLSTPNVIHIREAASGGSQYMTSSLGTQFMVDGAPISTNANMQYVSGAWDSESTYRDFTNAGVDMRSLSTDDIEKVEIVRGIASVEYGDLTSGLVKIERKKGGADLHVRLKADMSSKLFYLSKGLEWKPQHLSLNLSADYLDAKADPRNTLENYKRITFSARLHKQWLRNNYDLSLSTNADYTGSFDNDKVDPDLNYNVEDSYKSQYNRMVWMGDLTLKSKRDSWLKSAGLMCSAAYEYDDIKRRRLIQLQRTTVAATNHEEGEADALLLPWKYMADHEVEGKPLNIYAKLSARLQIPTTRLSNALLLGIDWNMDKNYGRGQVFDPERPLYPGISTRERPLYDIPANHRLSLFAEETLKWPTAIGTFEATGGIRVTEMLNLPAEYAMHGKKYLDPRINAGYTFPKFSFLGKPTFIRLAGGIGQHTKMPTMEQLFPDKLYIDFIQLNYYHENPDYRRVNLMTYIRNPRNLELQAARNLKWEMSADINIGGNRLSITYFREKMTSGFRSQTHYESFSYKEYDASTIDGSTLTAPPALSDMTYTLRDELVGYSNYTNGSETDKQGIEYTLETVRLPKILTRLTINGAWLHTHYRNSILETYRPSMVVGDRSLQYVGLYQDADGTMSESFNTNFTFDTDVPRLRLGFSLSAQFLWYTMSQRERISNTPDQYIAPDGTIHDWLAGDENDTYLQWLIRTNSETLYELTRVPMSMNLNLKVTKKLFADRLQIAMFCNKIWDYTPDYERKGYTFRRHVTPYFGLEMNVKI